MSSKLIYWVIFVVSALTLELEFLQTRIFSFILWHHFVYMVITVALLGYAAAGTLLSTIKRFKTMSDPEFFSIFLILFSTSIFISTKLAPLSTRNLFQLKPDFATIVKIAVSCLITMVPYLFSGFIIGGAFVRFPRKTSYLYFANLTGSATGCVAFVYLISLLGGDVLLVLSCYSALFLLLLLLKKEVQKYKRAIPFIVLWIIILAISPYFTSNSPEEHKQFFSMFSYDTVVEKTLWNPIARVDVISKHIQSPIKYIVMDGDAQAMLFSPALLKNKDIAPLRQMGYALLPRESERTLIIGAGGGFDTYYALKNGSQKIDAVEINHSTVKLVTGAYAGFLDHLFTKPGVNLYLEDGRSFVHNSRNQYDIINLFATDSLLALSVGAYVMADNYLYTTEAFCDYLTHLTDEGYLQISRWYNPQLPAESLRIFTTAFTALRKMGVQDPSSHIVVLEDFSGWTMHIIKRTLFTDEEKRKIASPALKQAKRYSVLYPEDITDQTNGPGNVFTEFSRKFLNGNEAEFYHAYPAKVKPVTDDSPFFYQFAKLSSYSKTVETADVYYDRIRGIWHLFVLSSLLIASLVLSAALIIAPLVVSRKKLSKNANPPFIVTFFLFIGLGFMLFEMAVIQKLVLFLGHPIYSMATVIPSLLAFAGLGSLASSRLKNLKLSIGIATALAGIAVILTPQVVALFSEPLMLLPLGAKIMVVILLTAPTGFILGIPFPTGLRVLNRDGGEDAVPWAWAVNGSASVISSVLAVIIAMQFGFHADIVIGGICYFGAATSAFLFLKSESNNSLS